jgi:hypothetical protein
MPTVGYTVFVRDRLSLDPVMQRTNSHICVSLCVTNASAHWREKRHVPSFHCNSIIGKLYDNVIEVINRSEDIGSFANYAGLAGRKVDKLGQILSVLVPEQELQHSLEKVYDRRIVSLLLNDEVSTPSESLQNFARKERLKYDAQLATIMNLHGIPSEGQVYTGCIPHNDNKKRRYEESQQVLEACRGMRNACREAFFHEVKRLCLLASSKKEESSTENSPTTAADNTMNNKDMLFDWIVQVTTGEQDDEERKDLIIVELARKIAHELAAAYYIATYNAVARGRAEGRRSKQVFFSFPWIVSDVIASGMLESNLFKP